MQQKKQWTKMMVVVAANSHHNYLFFVCFGYEKNLRWTRQKEWPKDWPYNNKTLNATTPPRCRV